MHACSALHSQADVLKTPDMCMYETALPCPAAGCVQEHVAALAYHCQLGLDV